MESIELQTRPRNFSNSNKEYKNNEINHNFSPIHKNFNESNPNYSNKIYKKDFVESPYINTRKRGDTNTSNKKNSKTNSKLIENNNKNINDCNYSPNKKNNKENNDDNNNYSQKNILLANTSRSTDYLLINENSTLNNFSITNKQEQESLMNLSCEALYYYLKEKGLLSNTKILLLTIITYLFIMITHSMNYSFLLFTRPIYSSYYFECMNPKTKTITKCTSRNVCFCEDYGRCVTMTWETDVLQSGLYNNTYRFGDMTFVSQSNDELKFKFGEILHYYMYDYKGKLTYKPKNSSTKTIFEAFESNDIFVNFNYKKKDKFCLMIFNCFVIVLVYVCGSIISEFVFGYLSDYIGKYIIINILAISFALNQIIYFILFLNIEEINQKEYSYFIWTIISFFLGSCTTPLKTFITCFYLELFPHKDELFSANGLIHSATSFSYIINFLFFIKIQQIQYIFIFYFVISVPLIVIFMKYFRENPRFYSETRNLTDDSINIELKKLAVMQIINTTKIRNSNLETVNSTSDRLLNETKKTLNRNNDSIATRKNNKEDLIFKKDEIEKKIITLKKIKSKNTKRMSMKKYAIEDLRRDNKKRRCPCPTFNFVSRKKEESEDYQNELVRKNTNINKKRQIINSKNINLLKEQYFKTNILKSSKKQSNNIKILRRHGRTSRDISSQDIDSFTKDLITYNYDNDLYIKKYIFTYSLVKLSFSLCYTSQLFFIHSEITNPNSDGYYRSFPFLFNIVFFTKLANILAGKFSFFINSRTLNMINLLVFGLIMIFVDMSLLHIDTQRNLYFGQKLKFFFATSNIWMRIISTMTISMINSLFEISVISYPPTLYRGKVMMKINLFANASPFITFIAIFMIDTWSIYIGIVALIVVFLYFTRLNDFNLEILESRDETYETQIKMYINKRFSKINIVDK